ncbi:MULTISPECIES: type VII secretion integral membrane protein EccD [unclassified Solwaraspora]|uniref:type VII secretion integral membrane protein EccD n=1 Tax=unclassified Solwaraspora TaxID=2627926 RepID=UPI00248CBFD2|nr:MULTISPECIES: type VII secretion integral membrane protein EccD [unclassified Solwaraspora]WBB97138.1 type VII secretion integral membrane protein EccD [Solwaraspora sp. WMMA2059]WBC18960.1 type VII secretion integral membrane protein EccD [Solwaraspora sp. WMMA2080]WJK33609.1 type VII secretion integral membrane protein EccD [Solwaraspora sp. WMMA2065]
MVTQAGTGLARIAVVAPTRRIDLALPEHLPLVGLLPAVLRQADENPSDGTADGGWALRRTNGSTLDLNRTLAAQQVRDGEMLHLLPRRTEWPELAYDDLMEAIAAGARRRGLPWTPAATRLTGLLAGAVLLLLALVAVVTADGTGVAAGAALLGTAAVLVAVGVLLSRAMADSLAGAALAALALPYAFAGGAVSLAGGEPVTGLGAPHLLVGSAALTLTGVLGMLGVGDAGRVFVAALFTGVSGTTGALLAVGPLDGPRAAAVLVAAVTLLLPALPLISVRAGKLPMPALPRTAEDLVRDDPQPDRAEIYRATARADEVLTGLMFGTAVVVAAGSAVLTFSATAGAVLLVAVVTAGQLLRARLVSTVRHRVPLLAGGLVGVGLLTLIGTGGMAAGTRLALLPVVLLVVALVLAAGMVYSRRPPTPRLARLGDGLDVVLQLAVVPVACAVLGLYGFMRAING